MPAEPLRVVSLIASSTEIVCALGLEEFLVGRSHECDFPASVRGLPICTEPKLNIEASSGDIDRAVKKILEQALSVYRVDADKLRSLRPTHIVTQTQCEVCAVSLRDVERALAAWLNAESGAGGAIETEVHTTRRPRIISLATFALADLWTDIQRIADAMGVPERGRALSAQLQARMMSIAQRARTLARPSVACIEWIDPLMASGNWMPELVEMAGGRNVLGEAGSHASWLDWNEVVAADPDYVLILPCGFDIARTRRELAALTKLPGWNEFVAARRRGFYLLDGNQFFNRPGPRLVESLEILAEILHPEAFHYGYKETGWQEWTTPLLSFVRKY